MRGNPSARRRLAVAALLAAGAVAAALPSSAGPIFDDGRLNPDPDEYYTLYCHEDTLHVVRSVPELETIKEVPIVEMLALALGASLDLGDFMILDRPAEDVLTVYGSNGNAAPEAGSKTFTLSECLERNGGVPVVPEDPPPDEDPPPIEETACRIDCVWCPECLIYSLIALAAGDEVLGNIEAYVFWDAIFDDLGPCGVSCMDACTGFPVPLPEPEPEPEPKQDAAGPLVSARARALQVPGPRSSEVFLLYAVREQILEPTPRGRHYRELYYTHADEILRLLVANWARWNEAFDLLVRFQPHLLALVEGRGASVVVSAEDVAGVEHFLDHLAASAGPALTLALAQERAQAQLGQLVGLTMEQARAVLVGPASCPDAPDPACQTGFAKGKLVVDERKPGKEKLVLTLKKGPALAQADLGDPTAPGGGEVSVCLYDDAGALAGGLGIARAGEECGRKPCWKPLGGSPPGGKGFAYKDATGLSDGLRKLKWKGGAAGKSSLAARAANRARKSETRLPDGVAAALAATSQVAVQVRSSEGACVGTTLAQVVKQESDLFLAK